jgi:hypothetical protein
MIRTIFAMAVAALISAAVPGTSQAAPIAPLSAGVIAGTGGVTPVYYYHRNYRHYYHHRYYYHRHYYHRHWRHCWWRHGYRHCW